MKKWHLLSYDICGPKRLRRVHYLVSKKCVALQQSVFLYYGSNHTLNELLSRIDALIVPEQDDVRVYPVTHPAHLWLGGQLRSAQGDSSQTTSTWRQKLHMWWQGIRVRKQSDAA